MTGSRRGYCVAEQPTNCPGYFCRLPHGSAHRPPSPSAHRCPQDIQSFSGTLSSIPNDRQNSRVFIARCLATFADLFCGQTSSRREGVWAIRIIGCMHLRAASPTYILTMRQLKPQPAACCDTSPSPRVGRGCFFLAIVGYAVPPLRTSPSAQPSPVQIHCAICRCEPRLFFQSALPKARQAELLCGGANNVYVRRQPVTALPYHAC